MAQDKIVSIVVPVYNRRTTICRCLDAIANQDGIDRFTLIVVDNNSTDGTPETVRRWMAAHGNVDVLLMQEHEQGAARARNAGLEAVKTPYVMFFDSDDEMLQGHLSRLLDGIVAYPDADILGWDVMCELPNGKEYLTPYIPGRPLYNQIVNSIHSTERYAAKTGFVRRVGGWCDSLRGWDDYELGVRLVLGNPVAVKLREPSRRPLVKAYFTGESITGSSFATDPGKWEDALGLIEAEVRAAKPEALCWVGFRRAVLAGMYAREGAEAEALRLLKESVTDGFGKVKSRIVYHFTRIFGRGARYAAALFMKRGE